MRSTTVAVIAFFVSLLTTVFWAFDSWRSSQELNALREENACLRGQVSVLLPRAEALDARWENLGGGYARLDDAVTRGLCRP